MILRGSQVVCHAGCVCDEEAQKLMQDGSCAREGLQLVSEEQDK